MNKISKQEYEQQVSIINSRGCFVPRPFVYPGGKVACEGDILDDSLIGIVCAARNIKTRLDNQNRIVL